LTIKIIIDIKVCMILNSLPYITLRKNILLVLQLAAGLSFFC
jgi:hypothetical protein